MIDLYFWTTPNGYEPLLLLEETGLAYNINPVNISRGEQFDPAFLKISPNNRIPAIVDFDPGQAHRPIALFESGAILQYLAEQVGQFAGRSETLQWLHWQIGGLGPMLGQNLHFSDYAPERIPYAIDRYHAETDRLFGVLDRRLADRSFVAGDDYSIADMASFPWVHRLEQIQPRLNDLPNLHRWHGAIAERDATKRAYKVGAAINTAPTVTEASKAVLLGQDASRAAA